MSSTNNSPEDSSSHNAGAEDQVFQDAQMAGKEQAEDGTGADEQPDTVVEEAETASNAAQEMQKELESLAARVKELEEENSTLKDQYLRKQADFENFRKRMTREKEDAVAYANKQLLLDLVTIIDDFERAIKSAEESKDFDGFHDGVAMIEKQFTGMLERKWGLKRFDSEGEEFDPQRHEAVTTEEVAEHEQSTVLEDYQKGYFLHDRVLRPAKVKVSLPPSQ